MNRPLFSLLLLAVASPVFGVQNARISMQATGQFESADTVVYSVFVASREEALESLQLSATMPANTRFLENVDAPASARYEGVADNIITWTLPAMDADTLAGPFTFRIRIDPSKADQTPSTPPTWISYAKPTVELLEDPGNGSQLKPLAESGTITIDAKGTLDASGKSNLVAVGETGILLYVPEGAVSGNVTFRFKRLVVEDEKMPQNAAGTWWCSLYEISTTPPNVNFARQIAYVLPSRRAVPIGIAARAFSSVDGKDWVEQTGGSGNQKLPLIGFGGNGGGCASTPFGSIGCRCTGFQCGLANAGCTGFQCSQNGFGVSATARTVGSISGSALAQQFGTSLKPAQIVDGTSNTIIAILIGIR